jgi:hypothetical protein
MFFVKQWRFSSDRDSLAVMLAQRIKTGFHRAGVLLAVLIAIPGVISLLAWLYWDKHSDPGLSIAFFVAAAAAYAFIRAIGWVISWLCRGRRSDFKLRDYRAV